MRWLILLILYVLTSVPVVAPFVGCTARHPPSRARQPLATTRGIPPPITQTRPRATHGAHYTLAIFPWNTGNSFRITSLEYGKSALTNVLANSAFVPVASYYTFPAGPPKLTSKDERRAWRRIWRWRAPGVSPHVDAAVELGRSLGVDAILTYAMDIQFGTDYLSVYLIDIATHRVYEANSETYIYEAEGLFALTTMTSKVLEEYLAQHGQPRAP